MAEPNAVRIEQLVVKLAGGAGGYGPIGKGNGAESHLRQGGKYLIGVALVDGNLYHSANYDQIESVLEYAFS